MLQRIDLADGISLAPGPSLEISGFPDDTLVRDALLALAEAAGVEPRWTVEIEKRIPVASGPRRRQLRRGRRAAARQ